MEILNENFNSMLKELNCESNFFEIEILKIDTRVFL